MPSIQSKAIYVLLRLMRMKRTVNRMRQRVESGDRTYSEPSKRLHRKHLISRRTINGHLVWTIVPRQNASNKHVIYLHGGAYVNSRSPLGSWRFSSGWALSSHGTMGVTSAGRG